MSTTIVLLPFLISIGLAALWFYFKNFVKAIRGVREKSYSIKLVLRFVGIFFPVLGAFMGMV